MDLKIFFTVFVAIFIAELGDKTQLATLLFAANNDVNKLTIFFAASLAVILRTAIGVLAGGLVSNYVDERYLHYLAGACFIVIGIYTLITA